MPDSILRNTIAGLVKSRKLEPLKKFLDAHSGSASTVVGMFKELHQKAPREKVLNFLDQALLLDYNKYPAYEEAMTAHNIARIYPSDLDTTSAPDNKTINSIRYMVDGTIPEDRTDYTFFFRWNSNSRGSSASNSNHHSGSDVSMHRRQYESERFFNTLAEKLDASRITPSVRA